MTTQMIIRIPDELKAKATKLARLEGKNLSALIRDLLEQHVRDRDMSAAIDDLWDRIGNRLQAEGVKETDIHEAILAARTRK